mmetsp:Transcript_18971/g.41225  ORF Transcript_18971/g.41225 Transcript_18971/m.41225 type:complete len:91 (+) Transcript_18971:624-896(+)|eukprot:CAMPEP_0168181838 /NCGR_PEP_ID=MMETSP0139_2-20121125/11494_1 /TAXON_ID=44445 /ORGANISM="Pseudo-nitzschia australis, Strain 10249 10 AB" /LENGTH=90 /DNA_ID=CAMNT_0008102569 /DNA_START=603 /DNA_END=875 /DNA_ORIENTATION=+
MNDMAIELSLVLDDSKEIKIISGAPDIVVAATAECSNNPGASATRTKTVVVPTQLNNKLWLRENPLQLLSIPIHPPEDSYNANKKREDDF